MPTYYVSTVELKSYRGITGTATDADVLEAVDTASRMVEEYKRLTSGRTTRYYPTVETRYYTADCNAVELDIEDFTGITAIAVDRVGNHSYSETWTSGTHYLLEPVNNPLESKPYRTIRLNPLSPFYRFPDYPQAVRVTGTFGWSTVPTLVKTATRILASRYYDRRNSPFGVLTVGLEQAAVRLPRTDPDVAQLLDAVDSNVPRPVA